VTREWGSEAELTKKAYANLGKELSSPVAGCSTLGELKDKIIELKLKPKSALTDEEKK